MGLNICYAWGAKGEEAFLMSYLCIDVEWNIPANHAGDIELMSIGAACWDSKSRALRTYFRLIRPEHMELITPVTYRLLNLGPVVIEQAKTCEEVLSNFVSTFFGHAIMGREDPVVFWSTDAWHVLKAHLDKCGLKIPSKRIVILQDVLRFSQKGRSSGKTVSFTAALQRFDVDYQKKLLHNSKHDARYLIDLYDAIYDNLARTGDLNQPLVHTQNSRILHYPGCHYMRKRQHFAGSWEDALSGWGLCKFCGREKRSAPQKSEKKAEKKACVVAIPLPECVEAISAAKKKKKKKTPAHAPFVEEVFTAYCEERGISYQFSIGWVFLRTPAAFWKIQHEDTTVLKVLHQSLRQDRAFLSRKQQPNVGYHEQFVYGKDIFGAVDYIYEHDRHFLNPQYVPSYWGSEAE